MKLNVAHVLCLILSGICIGFEVMSSRESPNVLIQDKIFKRWSQHDICDNVWFMILIG